MRWHKILGILLIILALSVIIGFAFKSLIYWHVFDVVVFLICGIGGVYLLVRK